MNRITNIERKFMRSIIDCCFIDKHIVIELDNFLDGKTSELTSEDLISLFKILEMIKKNKDISFEFVSELYNILFPSVIKENFKSSDTELILTAMNKDINDKTFDTTLSTTLCCVSLEKFNCAFAIIFTNVVYYLIYKKILFIPFYYIKDLEKYILLGKRNIFINLIKQIEDLNRRYLKIKKVLSLAEIKDLIKTVPKYQLKLLNIKYIYIYGSYAKQTNNQFSDIDMHIVLENDTYNLDVSAYNIKEYFDKLFDVPVDVRTTVYNKWYDSKYDVVFVNQIQVL